MIKIKNLIASVIAALTGLLGLVLYFLSKQNKQIETLKAKIDLAKTEKEADLIEVEIKELQGTHTNLQKTEKELDKTLAKVQEKRKQITEDVKNLKDPKEIAEYWNNS